MNDEKYDLLVSITDNDDVTHNFRCKYDNHIHFEDIISALMKLEICGVSNGWTTSNIR